MIEFLSKGGILIGPILFCSVVAVAIFIERLIRFASVRIRGFGLVKEAAQLVKKGETAQAIVLAQKSKTPMGRVLIQAIEVINQDHEILEAVLINATENEIRQLFRYIQTLATIGNIAPLLGLLGTVVGMIKSFMVIQEMGGKVNAAVLAGGISEAMLTTAFGLAVALPTMIAHSYLVSRVDNYEAQLQDGTVTFMKTVGKQT